VKNLLSALEVSKKFNLSYQTLNYYTNLGLLHSVKRQQNKRFYLEHEVRARLDKINELKNKGYPLKIIAQMVNGDLKVEEK